MCEDSKEGLVEMHVKFWEPYAKKMAAKGIDVAKRVPDWLPKIIGMAVERVSAFEVLLHHVQRELVLRIRESVKSKVVYELGWTEEPSHIVTIGIKMDSECDGAHA